MRKALVAGNWKMNGSREQAQQLVADLSNGLADCGAVDAVICPPAVFLDQVNQLLSASVIKLGAQNCSEFSSGAYTGEVSADMLVDFGCEYVILGHSERRALFLETNGQIAAKFEAAKAAGLKPIFCVGETLEQRQSEQTLAVIAAQVDAVLQRLGKQAFNAAVVAYEPVWAIGTGQTATPEQAQAVHAAIRAQIAEADADVAAGLQILYGGSVNAANAGALFAMADIDGGLVGGASLKAQDFIAICQAAEG